MTTKEMAETIAYWEDIIHRARLLAVTAPASWVALQGVPFSQYESQILKLIALLKKLPVSKED